MVAVFWLLMYQIISIFRVFTKGPYKLSHNADQTSSGRIYNSTTWHNIWTLCRFGRIEKLQVKVWSFMVNGDISRTFGLHWSCFHLLLFFCYHRRTIGVFPFDGSAPSERQTFQRNNGAAAVYISFRDEAK